MDRQNNAEEDKSQYHVTELNDSFRKAPSERFLNMPPELKELAGRVFQYIEEYDLSGLRTFLAANQQLDITSLYNFQGRTVLHSAAIKNEETILDALLSFAVLFLDVRTSEAQRRAWVNRLTAKEGLSAAHFTAWTGNIDALNTLIRYGADLHLVSPNGIGLMHIAAQADQVAFMVYLRHKGLSPLSTDKYLATPLHWACYSASETAVNYLLAWRRNVNPKDYEGYTPLHLAVCSALTSGNLRPMKILLLKGADRRVRNKAGLRPIDYVDKIDKVHPATTKEEIYQAIEEPAKFKGFFQMKMPLKKQYPSLFNILYFFLLYYFGSAFITLVFLPTVNSKFVAWSYWLIVVVVLTSFCIAWLREPGYVYKKPNPQFFELVQKVDPIAVCPECESIKSLRSRHCSICGKCVERYDHHCPWINNCVGTRNHGPFYTFVSSILLQLIYSLIITMTSTLFLSILTLGYFNVQKGKYAILHKTVFPPPYTVNFFLRNPALYQLAFVILSLYFVLFLFVVGILWIVQTKNLLLGRTTYERFSNLADPAYDGSQGELLNDHTDIVHLQNCAFMCYKCELPSQQRLEEYHVRNRFKSSASMLSASSISGLITSSYHKSLLFQQDSTSADILQEVKVEN